MHGSTGFIHVDRDVDPDYIGDANDKACRDYPAVEVQGHLVHVYAQGGEWYVWLNTEDMEFTGLCIAVGATRDLALAQAVAVCEAVAAHLQQPPRSEQV